MSFGHYRNINFFDKKSLFLPKIVDKRDILWHYLIRWVVFSVHFPSIYGENERFALVFGEKNEKN
jgi:hypothetical protein